MLITEFYWQGFTWGPVLFDLLISKGVTASKGVEKGYDTKRLYYVEEYRPRKFRIQDCGKDSPYGDVLRRDRYKVDVENYQQIRNELKDFVIYPLRKRWTSKEDEAVLKDEVVEGRTLSACRQRKSFLLKNNNKNNRDERDLLLLCAIRNILVLTYPELHDESLKLKAKEILKKV